jgi:hypothetical protein
MADQLGQMNKLLDPSTVIREGEISPDGYYKIQGGPNFTKDELAMINSAQQALGQIDPEGMEDAITGLEMTKRKLLQGGKLTEQESSGIMSIIQSLGGALKNIFVPSQEERIRLMEQRRIDLGE